jgi:Tol biopolymer transport system component
VARRVVFVLGIVSALGTILLVAHALANRASGTGLPVSTAREEGTDLYDHPQPVTIEGYSGRAMEPFIAPDGKTLFFNNSNEPGVDTNLHVAARLGPNAFRHVGELTGANSPVLDAVPSMDLDGRFYFTTVRQYDRDGKSIFAGQFRNGALEGVHAVEGTFSPTTPGWINMDVEISRDGATMYISRARFEAGVPIPKESDLMVATLTGDSFAIDPRSQDLLAKVNTAALEYAPAISTDGLELYFTRASGLGTGRAEDVRLRILVARRGRSDVPFDEPRVLDALTGYVEAPSLSLDGKEMFFHKKMDGTFVICRAERRH